VRWNNRERLVALEQTPDIGTVMHKIRWILEALRVPNDKIGRAHV
jgi:hypothetical protein